jgi:hypothetical protein
MVVICDQAIKVVAKLSNESLFNNHNVNNNVKIVVDQSSVGSSCHTPQCPSLATHIWVADQFVIIFDTIKFQFEQTFTK